MALRPVWYPPPASSADARDRGQDVVVHLQRGREKTGIVADDEVGTDGHAQERRDDGCEFVDGALAIDARDTEPSGGEEWCGGWECDRGGGGWGYASLECITDRLFDRRDKGVDTEVREVRGAS